MISSAVHKPSLEDGPEVELVYPFPGESIPLIWEWANESPEKLFDDYTLKTREKFIAEIRRLLKCRHIWGALENGYSLFFKERWSVCFPIWIRTETQRFIHLVFVLMIGEVD